MQEVKLRCQRKIVPYLSLLVTIFSVATVVYSFLTLPETVFQTLVESYNTMITQPSGLAMFGFDGNNETNSNSSFCVPWSINGDSWWTHNPDWEIFRETDHFYCFRFIQHQEKAEFLRDLYRNQFQQSCDNDNVLTVNMWSSGFGADMSNIQNTIMYAHATGVPFQVSQNPWHYAAPVEAGKAHLNADKLPQAKPVCSLKTMHCYFLNMSNCAPSTIRNNTRLDIHRIYNPRWYKEFYLRQQTWLRHRIHQFLQNQNIQQPCTVFHVRRGDVVKHGIHSRKYHSIAEYLNRTGEIQIEPNILLLTDDANAISEAKHTSPTHNWMSIDRPRYKGSEGGWERHLPSNDPAFEMIVLLSTFRLVTQCQSYIHTDGNFAKCLADEMIAAANATSTDDDRHVHILNMDSGGKWVLNGTNIHTESISQMYNFTENENAQN